MASALQDASHVGTVVHRLLVLRGQRGRSIKVRLMLAAFRMAVVALAADR
jgi:hypothetical protein